MRKRFSSYKPREQSQGFQELDCGLDLLIDPFRDPIGEIEQMLDWAAFGARNLEEIVAVGAFNP